MVLSRLRDVENPDPKLEQYRTPSDIVAHVLYKALDEGDIEGRSVMELGCGPAPFAIGALILGARPVHAVDIDPRAIEVARSNMDSVISSGLVDSGREIDLITGDISDDGLELPIVNTIIMNPPFGSQKRKADRPFIRAAAKHAGSIYSIHNGNTLPFLEKEWKRNGGNIVYSEHRSIQIPHRFHFHTKERSSADIVMIKVEIHI
jgi:putative methylase